MIENELFGKEGMRNMKGRKKRDAGNKNSKRGFQSGIWSLEVFARKIRRTTDFLRKRLPECLETFFEIFLAILDLNFHAKN